jgi:HEAT repeat protein
MAIRAIGVIGDTSFVPDLIHLLYHNNAYVRWWAQISLVRLTGRNFGADWNAWGNWWTSENRQPPFNPETVRWWRDQATPEQLSLALAADDQNFLAGLRQKNGPGPESEEK